MVTLAGTIVPGGGRGGAIQGKAGIKGRVKELTSPGPRGCSWTCGSSTSTCSITGRLAIAARGIVDLLLRLPDGKI